MEFEAELLPQPERVVHVEYLGLADAVCVVFEESLVLFPLLTREPENVGYMTDRVLAARCVPAVLLFFSRLSTYHFVCRHSF